MFIAFRVFTFLINALWVLATGAAAAAVIWIWALGLPPRQALQLELALLALLAGLVLGARKAWPL